MAASSYALSPLVRELFGSFETDSPPKSQALLDRFGSVDFSTLEKSTRGSPEHRVAEAFGALTPGMALLDHRESPFAAAAKLAAGRSGPSHIEAGDIIAVMLATRTWGPGLIGLLHDRLDQNAWAYLCKCLCHLDVDVEPDEVLATYTADTVHARHADLIGGVEREATAFARVCAATQIDPPLAIGVFGQWGTGKSYFMEKVHGAVASLSEASRARPPGDTSREFFHTHIVQIRFNAWHYIETSLWASLVEHIFAELDSWLRRQSKPATEDRDEVDNLFERLSTSRLLKLEAVDELVASRERQQQAAAIVEDEREKFRAALDTHQARRDAEFPWPAVMQTLQSDDQRSAAYREAGTDLGFDHLTDSGEKLAQIYAQSVDARGRALLLVNALSARFGKTYGWFIALVVLAIALPFVLTLVFDRWDTVQSAVAALCLLVTSVGTMLGTGLNSASKAISTIEEYRQHFDAAVQAQQKILREDLSRAEDHLAKIEADVGRAEKHLTEAERQAKQAAADFNAGTARGRLNRFIRDKVTKGDYARHLGLVTSIRRDFVELARLMREAGADDTRYDLEAKKFEADYRRRVEDTIVRAAARYCARIEARFPDTREDPEQTDETPEHAKVAKARAKARDYKAHIEARIGRPLPPVESFEDGELERGPIKPEPTLNKREIDRLWAGLDEPAKTKAPSFDRIILYIDDLDRCPPDKVVKVLQAAHLLLGFRLFVVLIAVDERWVSRALTHHYDQMLADPGREDCEPGAASSHDYLEKIFQLPYWVRPMSDEASTSFVAGLLERDARLRSPTPAPSSSSSSSAPDASTTARGGESERDAATSTEEPKVETPLDSSSNIEVESMLLSKAERDFMVALANVDSPRRGKRFVNAYRLIKASLPPHQLATFVRGGQSEAYRAVLVQLGIATGAPTAATAYFDRLHHAEHTDDGLSQVIEWAETLRPRDPDDRLRLVSMLRVAEGKVETASLREWTSVARRYSFVPQLR